jgi:hypothetical protein
MRFNITDSRFKAEGRTAIHLSPGAGDEKSHENYISGAFPRDLKSALILPLFCPEIQ